MPTIDLFSPADRPGPSSFAAAASPACRATLSERIEAAIETAAESGVGMVVEEDDDGLVLAELFRSNDAEPGAGRAALEMLLAIADDDDLPVTLSVVAFNSRLIAYYEAIGFEPTDLSDDEDWLVMRREPGA